MPDLTTGVVVIGGGATGAGVLRDLALRGVDAVLVERGEPASGTTGRSHGLLHSGARYCVTDEQTAVECREEGRVLRAIAGKAIDDTGGYFVALAEDADWEPAFVQGCRRTGIRCERISLDEVRRREPGLAAGVQSVYRVPDGCLDAVALVEANLASARRLGARVLTGHPAIGFLRRGTRIEGVRLRVGNEETTIGCRAIINAAGPWAGAVAELLGIRLALVPVKGVLVALEGRLVSAAVNRCRRPGEGDIIVPGRGQTIVGTTSAVVPGPDALDVDQRDVVRLLGIAGKMVNGVGAGKVRRAYAGVRPLITASGSDGQSMSRTFAVVDHQAVDGVQGFTSVVGGKLTTFRLMAERTVDLVAGRLGVRAPCRSAEVPLDGAP